MKFTADGYPRRSDIALLQPHERELVDLMAKIEELGAHPLLTDCTIHLDIARMRLADWVELSHSDKEIEHGRRD